ncbi:MAG TPA: AtpZ/AtpI family protein [Oscillospiraceae bacterium]|nr:AtpZ/AtpI family protein [Oscillospiraceae bacterium]
MKREDFTALRVVIELALSISCSLLGGVYLGRFLGQRFGHPSLYLLAGILLGLLAGFGQAKRILLKK